MNRWSRPGPGWDQMIKGIPAYSGYFWMAVLFTICALLGEAHVASKIYGHRQLVELWAPAVIGCFAMMAIAAGGAVRSLRTARREARANAGKVSEAVEKLAFEKLRTYTFCAAFIGIAMSALVTIWRFASLALSHNCVLGHN